MSMICLAVVSHRRFLRYERNDSNVLVCTKGYYFTIPNKNDEEML